MPPCITELPYSDIKIANATEFVGCNTCIFLMIMEPFSWSALSDIKFVWVSQIFMEFITSSFQKQKKKSGQIELD